MAWTTIAAARQDADSPVDEDLIQDLVANTEYNHDHAVRAGTHATGVRLALAEGRTAITGNTDFSGIVAITKTINLNTATTDALDGNPNFLALRNIVISLEEDDTGSEIPWTNFTGSATKGIAYYVVTGPTIASFDVLIKMWGGPTGGELVNGFINWTAYGTVATAE